MPRYRLDLEYDGAPFNGFQAQADQPSVQGALERAVLGFCGETVRVHVAGRTDTGVHATGQVAHIDLTKAWAADVVQGAINAHLVPAPVVVLAAREVADDWHARFSATGRRYRYRILDRRPPAALERGRVWWIRIPLDVEAMHAAAQRLSRRPMPGQVAPAHARPGRCAPRGTGSVLGVRRAQLPASPGPLHDRLTGRGGRRTLERGRRRRRAGRRRPHPLRPGCALARALSHRRGLLTGGLRARGALDEVRHVVVERLQ
jgi:hypothetical protein